MKKLFLSLFSLAVAFTASAQTLVRVNTYDNLVGIVPHGTDPKLIAVVGGDASRNDGFGGVFYYNGDSTEATNNFGVFRPTTVASDEPGRWFRVAGQFWNQDSSATSDQNSYAYQLYRNGATNVFGIGADNNFAYLQSWATYGLWLNSQGNPIRVGATGSNIVSIVSNAQTLDFPSINTQSINTQSTTNLTITVNGATTNSAVSLGYDASSLTSGITLCAGVSAANTVTVTAANVTSGAVNPAALTVRATVINH